MEDAGRISGCHKYSDIKVFVIGNVRDLRIYLFTS
jgi:hypothetical protein